MVSVRTHVAPLGLVPSETTLRFSMVPPVAALKAATSFQGEVGLSPPEGGLKTTWFPLTEGYPSPEPSATYWSPAGPSDWRSRAVVPSPTLQTRVSGVERRDGAPVSAVRSGVCSSGGQ